MRKNEHLNSPECADYGEVSPVPGSRPKPAITPQEEARLKKAVQLLRSGELTLEEVDEIEKEFGTISGDRGAVYQGDPSQGLGLYQAIIKESIEALFQYIVLLGGGRIVEVGSGDGKLSAALRKKGLDVTATDDGSWGISSQPDIIVMDAKEAAGQADILLFSWPPLSNAPRLKNQVFEPPDLILAKAVQADPQKTFIILGAYCTGSSEFWAQVMGVNRPKYVLKEGQMVVENPDWLSDPTPQVTIQLQQKKPDGLNQIIGADGHLYQLGRSRLKNFNGKDGSFVLALRSPKAPCLPSLGPQRLETYTPPPIYRVSG